ncbi:NADPH-dependent FMN reductase [Halalkalibacillus sediminis]|uniref:NADPH-dependent FMN reductase n=1 Tax=Halalkalibacillus sediminis TaxID=2018042 RepID=UPI0013900836|nr:NAD(P)H-dependent oxidoreductase [Halalkalibacillus sediminis]
MSRKLKVVGISGSLREDSFNRKLLELAASKLPEEVEYEYADYSDVPLFNQDTENPMPKSVMDFKATVDSADILLFSTPQYNGSIPGVLKNGIDWLTRPYGENSLSGKVAGVIGATPGGTGTINAQDHLREILSFINVLVPPHPRVFVSEVHNKVDEQGDLQLGDQIETSLINQLEKLVELTKSAV